MQFLHVHLVRISCATQCAPPILPASGADPGFEVGGGSQNWIWGVFRTQSGSPINSSVNSAILVGLNPAGDGGKALNPPLQLVPVSGIKTQNCWKMDQDFGPKKKTKQISVHFLGQYLSPRSSISKSKVQSQGPAIGFRYTRIRVIRVQIFELRLYE